MPRRCTRAFAATAALAAVLLLLAGPRAAAATPSEPPPNDPALGLALPPADTRAARAALASLRAAGVPLIYRAEASVVHCNDRGLDKHGRECAAFDARYRGWAATLGNNPAFEALARLRLPEAFDAAAAARYCAAHGLRGDECARFTDDYRGWTDEVAAGDRGGGLHDASEL